MERTEWDPFSGEMRFIQAGEHVAVPSGRVKDERIVKLIHLAKYKEFGGAARGNLLPGALRALLTQQVWRSHKFPYVVWKASFPRWLADSRFIPDSH